MVESRAVQTQQCVFLRNKLVFGWAFAGGFGGLGGVWLV